MKNLSFNYLKDNIYVIIKDKKDNKKITIIKTLKKEYNKKIEDYQYQCEVIFDNIHHRTKGNKDFYLYKKLFEFMNVIELIKDHKKLEKKYKKFLNQNYIIQESLNFEF